MQRHFEQVRPLTEHLWFCLMFDSWPDSPAVLIDFGIASADHFGALQYAAHDDFISIDQLDKLLGNGPALTPAIDENDGNPYKGIIFKTPYDVYEQIVSNDKSIEEDNNAQTGE
jgi:hypothetical protein